MSYLGCIIADYYCTDCQPIEQGRVRAVAYTLRGAALPNPSAEYDWAALVDAKAAYVIHDVRGTYDGGSEVEGPGYGSVSTQTNGMNHSSNYMHTWSCQNAQFYNDLRYSRNWGFWFLTENYIHYSETTVSASGKMPVTDDLNNRLEFSVNVKWAYKDMPTCYAKPTKIFDSCLALAAAIDCNGPFPPFVVVPC